MKSEEQVCKIFAVCFRNNVKKFCYLDEDHALIELLFLEVNESRESVVVDLSGGVDVS